MNDSGLVRAPLKTSGSSPIAFVSWAQGTPPRGPPSPWNGFDNGGSGSSSSILLNALLKLIASLVSVSELIWVTMVGGSYLRAKHVFQAELGVGKGVWMVVGLCLICLSRAF